MSLALLRALQRNPGTAEAITDRLGLARRAVDKALLSACRAGLVARARSHSMRPYVYRLAREGRARLARAERLATRLVEADAALGSEPPWDIAARLGWSSADEMVDAVCEWRRARAAAVDSAAVAGGGLSAPEVGSNRGTRPRGGNAAPSAARGSTNGRTG